MDMDGSKNSALFVAARRSDVVVWQEDGSVVIYAMAGDGTLNRKFVLNGHIQGGYTIGILVCCCCCCCCCSCRCDDAAAVVAVVVDDDNVVVLSMLLLVLLLSSLLLLL